MNATQILKSSQPGGKGGCLKCGELGHWARDCQAPRDKQIAYQQERKKKQAEDVLGVGSLPGGGNDDEKYVIMVVFVQRVHPWMNICFVLFHCLYVHALVDVPVLEKRCCFFFFFFFFAAAAAAAA